MKTASSLVVELTLAQGLTLDLARDLSGGPDRRFIAEAFAHNLDTALAFADALSRVRGVEFYDRALHLRYYLNSVLALARSIHRVWDSDRVKDLCHVLVGACRSAGDLVRSLEGAKMPSEISCRLTGWAARLLPLADRLEYAELFQSELHDLAQSGSGRWAQLRHALRVLLRAPLLRRELRTPAPATPERL